MKSFTQRREVSDSEEEKNLQRSSEGHRLTCTARVTKNLFRSIPKQMIHSLYLEEKHGAMCVVPSDHFPPRAFQTMEKTATPSGSRGPGKEKGPSP